MSLFPPSFSSFVPVPVHGARPVSRLRRAVVRATVGLGLAAAVVGGAVVGTADPVSAQQPALAGNALAPQISSQAELAVAAYDQFLDSDDLADYLVYAAHRTATARLAAQELGYDEWEMIDAWKSTSLDHQRAVLAAMSQVGVPYKTNASKEGVAFDCSGLTSWAWRSAGNEIDRISRDQIRAAAEVEQDEAKAGDLAYYPGHVMMYLGVDNAVVHARNTGRTVEVEALSDRRAARVEFGDPTE